MSQIKNLFRIALLVQTMPLLALDVSQVAPYGYGKMCKPCKDSHQACDGGRPCGKCRYKGISSECVNVARQRKGRRPKSEADKIALTAKRDDAQTTQESQPCLRKVICNKGKGSMKKRKYASACTNCRLNHKGCLGGPPCQLCEEKGLSAEFCVQPPRKKWGRPKKNRDGNPLQVEQNSSETKRPKKRLRLNPDAENSKPSSINQNDATIKRPVRETRNKNPKYLDAEYLWINSDDDDELFEKILSENISEQATVVCSDINSKYLPEEDEEALSDNKENTQPIDTLREENDWQPPQPLATRVQKKRKRPILPPRSEYYGWLKF